MSLNLFSKKHIKYKVWSKTKQINSHKSLNLKRLCVRHNLVPLIFFLVFITLFPIGDASSNNKNEGKYYTHFFYTNLKSFHEKKKKMHENDNIITF